MNKAIKNNNKRSTSNLMSNIRSGEEVTCYKKLIITVVRLSLHEAM